MYGLYNGIIIALSRLMMQNYRKRKKSFHINEKLKSWRVFPVARTLLLVNISWFFERIDSVSQALVMIKNAVTCFRLQELHMDDFDCIVDGFSNYEGHMYEDQAEVFSRTLGEVLKSL